MKSSLTVVLKTKLNFLFSKTLLSFLEQKYILFSETYFFKIPKNLITPAFFLLTQILKKIDMPWQKPPNAALVKLTD